MQQIQKCPKSKLVSLFFLLSVLALKFFTPIGTTPFQHMEKGENTIFSIFFLLTCILFPVWMFAAAISISVNTNREIKANKISHRKIYKSIDNFSEILYSHNESKINYPKQSFNMARDLLERDLSSWSLHKETAQDFATILMAFTAIYILGTFLTPLLSTIEHWHKIFPTISAVAGVLIVVFKIIFILSANHNINKLKRCLIVVNWVIDKIEEDEKARLKQWEKFQ